MKSNEIKSFLEKLQEKSDKGIVIVDWANVEKWEGSLGWKIGIRQLRNLINNFSVNNKSLRRFYYALDYGPDERHPNITNHSQNINDASNYNKFEFVTKPVKYIHDRDRVSGYQKKGNLDVEMVVDLLRLSDEYDQAVIFSGDGDLAYVYKYLSILNKEVYVFAARDHVGREVIDAEKNKVIRKILFTEDFEIRLSHNR